jgi:hypothetical protein
MRFDCNESGDIMSEVAAYGTAVTVEPIHFPTDAQDLASTTQNKSHIREGE